MGKKASKKVGNQRKSVFDKSRNRVNNDKKIEKLEKRLEELSDEDIEKLFESGKIDQSEYEYILALRKKKKEKKKSDKEKFEERIRCNDTIIQKVIELGRKFRLQEMLKKQENEESRRKSALLNQLKNIGINEEEKDIEREERMRTRNDGVRSKNEHGRGKTRDSRW